jgi:hypothetical protein
MAECELLSSCIFFNDQMATMPVTAKLLKDHYCHGDYTGCARYMVYHRLGRAKVPTNLTPNDVKRAKAFLKDQS